MKEIKQIITINRPVHEVFRFVINPENTPKWIDGVVTEQTNETPTRLGTVYKNQDHEGNWREFEITDYKSDMMFVMTKKDDSHHVKYLFKPLGNDLCELEYSVWVDGGEIRGTFTQETIQKILQKLKGIIEE